MKETHNSLLLINENGEVLRKRVPFWITLKDEHSNRASLLVKRIVFEGANIILYEIDEVEFVRHSDCDIVSERIMPYSEMENIVYLVVLQYIIMNKEVTKQTIL